jgi:hypothetical protein
LLWDLTGRLNSATKVQAKPRPEEFDALWSELNGDAVKAYRVIQRLTAHPPEAIALVAGKLPPAKVRTAAELDPLIADLDHPEFERREQVSKALAEIGKPATVALTKTLETRPSAEKKRRIGELMETINAVGTRPEMVRPIRALEILERAGTVEAKKVLEKLAHGDAEAPLTQQAKATLKRLTAR